MAPPRNGSGALALGGVAAVLASACCLGPLVLVLLGVGGAWIGNLTALAPYRPWFISAALIALFFAWRGIFRSAANCEPGQACAASRVRSAYKFLFCVVLGLVAIALVFPYLAPLFY